MPYKPGNWYVRCDRCGLKRYRSECVKTWDNLIVCRSCDNGPRNPQDYLVKPLPDKQYVPDPRPDHLLKPTLLGTTDASSITTNSAVSGGQVTNDGGATVTDKGICWSTSHAPDTDDDSYSNGSGTGEFTSYLTGLSPNTTYYVRAYATNSVGTAYGPEMEFTTHAS